MRSSPWERGFLAAVQEVGDVRIFFGFRHAELGAAGFRDHLAEQVIHALGREQRAHQRGERIAVAGHAGGGGEADAARAREEGEIGLEQSGEQFADAIGAEIEAQQGVAVAHAAVIVDHRGYDELVGDVGIVAGVDRRGGVGVAVALALGHRGVGSRYPVPAFVAVHGVVAAADRGDRGAVGQLAAELGEAGGAGAGRGVAAVHPGVHAHPDAGIGQHPGECDRVILMRVHAALGEQAHQVAGAAAAAQRVDQGDQGGGRGRWSRSGWRG